MAESSSTFVPSDIHRITRGTRTRYRNPVAELSEQRGGTFDEVEIGLSPGVPVHGGEDADRLSTGFW